MPTLVPGAAAPDPSPVDTEAVAALEIAIRTVNGVAETDCETNNPEQRSCVSPLRETSPERGIAAFSIRQPSGPGGGVLVLGRTDAGEWRYWFGGQQYYQRTAVPGDMLVCADGDGANVRAAPGFEAPILTLLTDLTVVIAVKFVLTEPGSYSLGSAGAGWYRISGVAAGWMYSTLLADARTEGCALRNALVNR